jgi:hypothetical protein
MFTKEQQEVIDNFPIFIPEPVRTNYFRNVFVLRPDAIAFLKSNIIKDKKFIDGSFIWSNTPEGRGYWGKIFTIYLAVPDLLDEPGISKRFVNAGIPVELASPKANITYSVTEPLILATKTCVRPLPGFTVMNDYLLNSQGEIRDDAGIWRNLSLHEQRSFIDSGETKIAKHKTADIPVLQGLAYEKLLQHVSAMDDKPFAIHSKFPLTEDKAFAKTDKADYDGPTKIFSAKKRKSKFSPTNNIS